jgi:diadenosine tetraphosphate (Ap4A) HIT family hydrolase
MLKWIFILFLGLGQVEMLAAKILPIEITDDLVLFAYREMPEDSTYDKNCMPCTPSESDAGTIAFSTHWKIVYVPNQSYLGRLVVSSQRHFGAYDDMNADEAREYQQILRELLPALKNTFNVTHFNVAYLMNMAFNAQTPEPAFKDGKPNPHFHWHIIPRYDGVREFAGESFEDPNFGAPFDLQRKKYLVGEFRKQAVQAIREKMNITYLP